MTSCPECGRSQPAGSSDGTACPACLLRIGLEFGSTAMTAPAAPPASVLPDRIGRYEILRLIGQGGMGVVFEARQERPRRRVALKVIRGGDLVDEQRVRLFQREVQALARLRHPGIATIHESGHTDDGQHYFAMELVEGETLDDFLRPRPTVRQAGAPEARRRLELFLQICDAVSYAHHRGVIHRDLKPSNIMVLKPTLPEPTAGVTEAAPRPIKILDFGLARITKTDLAVTTIVSRVGQIQGTVPYMSPEQVRGDPDDIDLRSDIYALGVILYEMLSGALPYDMRKVSLAEAARVICEARPIPFRTLFGSSRAVHAEVEIIISKALEKDPDRRYQSAVALAEDIRRHLAGLPIMARPHSAAYQIRKLVARHKGLFSLAAALVLLLALFAPTMTLQAGRIAAERDRANLEAGTAREVTDYLVRLFEVADPGVERANSITVREVLDRGADEIRSHLSEQPRTQARLLDVMGRVYQNLGLYQVAKDLLQEAVAIKEDSLGENHLETSRSLVQLGFLTDMAGEPEAAVALQRRALDIAESNPDASPLDVGWPSYHLGRALARSQDVLAGKASLEKALEIFRAELGPEDLAVAWCLNDLAVIVYSMGLQDHETAIELMEESLRIKELKLGPNHYDVVLAYNNLGYDYLQEGDYGRAEEVLLKAFETGREILGPEHPQVVISVQHSLAELYYRTGRLTEAEALLTSGLAVLDKSLNPRSYENAEYLLVLGQVRQAQNRLRDAASCYRKALAIAASALPPEHPIIVKILAAIESLDPYLSGPGQAQSASQAQAPHRGPG